jgi:hypothetical protein
MLLPSDPNLIPLADARRKFPHGRGRGQMNKYRLKGVRNRLTGERVYLECVWIPSGWATTPAAWERFLVALNRGINA